MITAHEASGLVQKIIDENEKEQLKRYDRDLNTLLDLIRMRATEGYEKAEIDSMIAANMHKSVLEKVSELGFNWMFGHNTFTITW